MPKSWLLINGEGRIVHGQRFVLPTPGSNLDLPENVNLI